MNERTTIRTWSFDGMLARLGAARASAAVIASEKDLPTAEEDLLTCFVLQDCMQGSGNY